MKGTGVVCLLGMTLARAFLALVAQRQGFPELFAFMSWQDPCHHLNCFLPCPPMVVLGYHRGILLLGDPKHHPVQTAALVYSRWPALPWGFLYWDSHPILPGPMAPGERLFCKSQSCENLSLFFFIRSSLSLAMIVAAVLSLAFSCISSLRNGRICRASVHRQLRVCGSQHVGLLVTDAPSHPISVVQQHRPVGQGDGRRNRKSLQHSHSSQPRAPS